MKRYSIGLDYGTLSVRALLIDFTTGEELACCEYEYPHAVMDARSRAAKSSRPTGHCRTRRIIWTGSPLLCAA